MQKIFNFFPLSIYKSSISLTDSEKNTLIDDIYKMEKNSQNLKYKAKNSAWTGDTQGFEFLHNNSNFEKLFKEIYKSIIEYLESLSVDHSQLNIFFQRSWATISRNGENIENHRHAQSHISFAYYLKKKDNDSKITFYDDHRHNEIIPALFSSATLFDKGLTKSRGILNSPVIIFDTKEDDLIIFPSKTLHGTQRGQDNDERISISADIVLLAKDSKNLEHLSPSIDKWKLFSN